MEREEGITVCDLTGIAAQDVVTSRLVYERGFEGENGFLHYYLTSISG